VGIEHRGSVRILAAILVAVVALALLPSLAQAQQRRIALVIGNDDYENVPKLEKAVNDAEAVAKHLTDIGFTVTLAKNIGRRATSRAVVEFEKQVQQGDLALFYFAGHGYSISGQDFLLPVDIPQAGPGEESMVRDEAFMTNDFADRLLRAGAATAILILDACRNNPFEQAGMRSIGGNSGLANQPLGEGIFVLYSAGQYQSALDGMGPGDDNPNSVFTRALLKEFDKPNASMVDIAKATQVTVRDMASQIGHVQLPSYYDQILGSVVLNPKTGEAQARGSTESFQEGTTVAALPRLLDPAPKEGKGKPTASFTRSNAGWTVAVSLPEPALQFGYRIGETGEFTDPGLSPTIDQQTGRPMPVTWFMLPDDQPAGDLFVTWRDRRGEEAGVFPIRFDPDDQLKSGQRQILDQMWTAWVSFREFNGPMVYFTHLVTYRCALQKIEYAFDNSGDWKSWPVPECDPVNPYNVPDNAELYSKISKSAKSMQVVVTYYDGTKSPARNFNVKY